MRRGDAAASCALPRDLLDLAVLQIDRGGTAEDGHRDPQARRVLVDALDLAVEAGERAVDDLDGLADVEADGGFGRSTPSSTAPMMFWTSRSETGSGLVPPAAPRKPVTFGVFLTR